MSALHILLLIIIIIIINYVITVTSRHNITAILYAFPEYTEFNNYLTQTKLNEEINNRETITVLVLSNSSVSALASKHPLSVLKDVLSLHILLDYYDNKKLHNISNNGTTLSVITLYNTTENSPGIAGFVNITTDSKSGKVSFGSAVSGSKLDSSYTKSVKQIPYNISVLEIDMPILAPGVLTAHAHRSTDVITITVTDLNELLKDAGCNGGKDLNDNKPFQIFRVVLFLLLMYHLICVFGCQLPCWFYVVTSVLVSLLVCLFISINWDGVE